MTTDASPAPPPLTGWEFSAPTTDTVLRQFLLAQSAFQRASGEALGATVVETDEFIAIDTGRPATMINFAVLRQPLSGPALDAAMDALGRIYGRPDARGFVALYSPLPTADLRAWGWTLAGHPPLQLRSPFTPLLETGSIRVEPVSTAEHQATLEQIMIRGFEMDEMAGQPAGSLLGPGLYADARFGAWLGLIDGEPVSGAASLTEAGIVDIVMVATLPQARRKGAALAVTQAAARPELGLPGVLFSSDDGRPVYERLGFTPILRGAFWYRVRSGTVDGSK